MSASPVPEHEMLEDSVPGWLIPPPGGFTAADLDRLPGIPPHTELIDGTLVFVSPQTRFHSLIVDFLLHALKSIAPEGMRVEREMTVVLGPRQRPEPDFIVLRPGTDADLMRTYYDAADVLLAVEVMSKESEERDRKRKPLLYAEAGIPHFWLVEYDGGHPVVYVHELDKNSGAYALTGIYHDRLMVGVPFPIDVDLTEITGG